MNANFNNILWLVIEKTFRVILNLLVGAMFVRYLGPAQFGAYSYLFSFMAIFQGLSYLGLDAITIREFSSGKVPARKIIGTILIIRALFGLAFWLISLVVGLYVITVIEIDIWCMLLVGAILPLQSLEVVDLYLQSKTKISLSVRVRLFSFFILTFIKLTFIYCKIDIEYFIMLAVVESVFIGLGYWRILVNIFGLKMFKDIDVKYGINLISEGWPIAVSGLLMWIGYRADQIIVGHFLDIESVGLYAAILPFSTAWQFIPVMLTSVFSNKIYKLKLNSASAYKDAMFKIISIYTILSFLICIFTYCIADWLMDSIYGESLAGASILLKIHVWTNLFISINLALNIWYTCERLKYIPLISSLLVALTTIFGNIFVINSFGLVGVVSVAVLSNACSVLLMYLIKYIYESRVEVKVI